MQYITIHQDWIAPSSGSHAAHSKNIYRLMGLMGEGFKPFKIYATTYRQEAELLAEMIASRPENKGKTVIKKTYK